MWGFISPRKWKLFRLPPKCKAADYVEMLEQKFYPEMKDEISRRGLTLQQDNAPIHRALLTQAFLSIKKIPLLKGWPAYSPDLNIIENIWALMQRKVYESYRTEGVPGNADILFERCETAFNEVCSSFVTIIYRSMKRRLREVIRLQGKRTRY